MANPNPTIWGEPNTWIYAKLINGLTTPLAQSLKIDKPKTANFGADDNINIGALVRAVYMHVMEENKPIDLSICPCGQDAKISAYGKIAIYNETGEYSAAPRIIERTSPVNWCMYDGRIAAAPLRTFVPFTVDRIYARTDTEGMKYDQWSPKAVNTSAYNNNYYISPYVFWHLRTILLQIEVECITSEDANGILTTWRTLSDWKNTYSAQPICGVRCKVNTPNNFVSDTGKILYSQGGGVDYYFYGKTAILDAIPNINNDGTLTDTNFYCFLTDSNKSTYMYLFRSLHVVFTAAYKIMFMPAWDMFNSQTVHKLGNNDTRWLYYKIPYSEDNYNKVLSMVACFGCLFTPTDTTVFDYNLIDNDMYMPIIDDNGITHGEYTHGTDNTTNDLYNATSIRDKNYNPGIPVDTNTYSNITGFNIVTNNAALTKFYVLDSANVEKLGDDLWTICDGLSSGDFEHFEGKIKDEFLTTNPIDSIIALKRFPFNVPHTFNPNKVPVQLGKSTGTAQGYRTFEILFGVNFKGVDIFPRFGDCFLDYSPYTKYELYIPFCGTVEINAGDVLGHKLNCQLLIDLLTGSCIAYIMADQLVIGTAKGSCGVDMQMSGAQTATMNANIFNGILNAQLAETQHITSIGKISLNPFKWYENIEVAETRQLQTQHDITHMVVPLHKMGSASPLLSWVQEFNARLMIYYPEGDVITSTIPPELNSAAVSSFGHIKGFATATPGKVSSFQRSGKQCYLSGNIVADSIPCTDNERQRIIAAFNSGVYLPSL